MPLPTPAPIATQPASSCQPVGSRSLFQAPSPTIQGANGTLAVLWQQIGTKARYGVPRPLLPSDAGTSQLPECLSRRAQSWAQGPSCRGKESVAILPFLPLHSLQLSEERNTADEYRHQSLAYLQSSQESMQETAIRLFGEPQPQGSSCPTSALPQPWLLHWQQDLAQRLWSPGSLVQGHKSLGAAATLSHPGVSQSWKVQGSALPGEEVMWAGWKHWRGRAESLGP